MRDKIKYYICIFIIAIIVCIPLFMQEFSIYIDDGIQHVCRLMGTYQSIEEGQIFPVIMSNFCNGFGYSWNLFYSPITAYVPLLFKIFTNSFELCLKLFIVFVTFFTGISMYEFIKKITKNKNAGLLGATIYMLAPYRLTDIYMRMAVSELASFIFLPIVFHGLYNIFNDEDKEKSGILLAIGAIGLILSHTVITMYTAIFGALYVIINFKKLKDKVVLKKLAINLIFVLCITSFFLLPMLEHKLDTQYEVFKDGRMIREDALVYYKLKLKSLFYTKQGALVTEIGLITIIGFLLSVITINKIDKKYKTLYLFSFFAGIISVVMSTELFPFEKLPTLLKMLQFPFRMLEFSSFFLCIVVTINYYTIIKNFNVKDALILTTLAILLTIPVIKKYSCVEINITEDKLWPAVSVNQNTGRVHAGCASFEYLPSKAFDNLDYIKTREDRTYILLGNGEIVGEEKNGTNMTIEVLDISKDTVLELPYIYYLGYYIKLESNGKEENIEYYESDKGFVAVQIDENIEKCKIEVSYEGTNFMKISMVVSIIGFTFMIIYYCYTMKRRVS